MTETEAKVMTRYFIYTGLTTGLIGFILGLLVYSIIDKHSVAPVALKSPDSLYCKPFHIDTVFNMVTDRGMVDSDTFPLLQDSTGCPINQQVSEIVYWRPVTGGRILAQGD